MSATIKAFPFRTRYDHLRDNARAIVHAGGVVVVRDVDGTERRFSGNDKEDEVLEWLARRPDAIAFFGGTPLETFKVRDEPPPAEPAPEPEAPPALAPPADLTEAAEPEEFDQQAEDGGEPPELKQR